MGLASQVMRLGFYMGYAPPGTNPRELVELAQEAERLGYDSAWAAEAWGTDAVSVLAWLAALTQRIKVGSAIMQIPARTPAATAMTAATLDLMSGGRFLLGLGTSGPQVVEGWHGQEWGKPLARTREYVEIVRAALRREPLAYDGQHYRLGETASKGIVGGGAVTVVPHERAGISAGRGGGGGGCADTPPPRLKPQPAIRAD